MFQKAHELYNKLLNIFKTFHKKLIEDQNMSGNLSINLYLDDLPPMYALECDEEVK